MTQPDDIKAKPFDLRKRAEESVRRRSTVQKDVTTLSLEEIKQVLHNLSVHQIELEMQNEEMREAQYLLSESRDRLSDLYDHAPVGYFTIGTDGVILEVNLTGSALLEADSSSLIGKRFQSLLVEEYAEAFHLHERAAFKAGTKQRCEIKLRKPDGGIFDAQLESLAIEDRDGRVTRCRTIVSDITERKQAEDALRESQQMMQLVLDTIPVRVFWKDLESNYLGCNRAFALDAGLQSPEKIIGRNDFEMGWAEQAELYRSDDRLVMETGRPKLGYEEPQTTPDGCRIWLRTNKVPLRDAEGRIKGVLGTYEDITESKLMEKALRDARDALEIRVEERTLELQAANKVLRENEKELRAIPSRLIAVQEDERKRLASELHDSIGQTLAALKYRVEVILDARDRGELGRALELFESFVPILQHSIEETRSIYMGLRPSILDSLGVVATLEWFCREFQKIYPGRHIEVEAGIKEEEIPEPLKIAVFRIIQESLNNIAKHSKADWVGLSLAKRRDAIELTITDNGIGMDLGTISQTNALTTLGLRSMRDRAEHNGGTLSIESTPGKGTTVRVVWPGRDRIFRPAHRSA